jgi:hypothetical protein
MMFIVFFSVPVAVPGSTDGIRWLFILLFSYSVYWLVYKSFSDLCVIAGRDFGFTDFHSSDSEPSNYEKGAG